MVNSVTTPPGSGLTQNATTGDVVLGVQVPLSLTGADPANTIITGTNNDAGGGLKGESTVPNGAGVYAFGKSVGLLANIDGTNTASAPAFTRSAAVLAANSGDDGSAVLANGNGAGVYATGVAGPGVYGESSSDVGVHGKATGGSQGVIGEGKTVGVYGTTVGDHGGSSGAPYTTSAGVLGSNTASDGAGVLGDGNGVGVRGYVVGSAPAMYGTNTGSGDGMRGENATGKGVTTAAAVHGKNASGGLAGLFEGNVRVTGTISSASDHKLKDNFASVDRRAVLARLVDLPLDTWTYASEGASIRHIGPTAQDFQAAFGVGQDDTTIATVDADGVAFAAIQGLHQLVQDKDVQLVAQEQRLSALEQQNTALEARLAALEQQAGTNRASGPREMYAPSRPDRSRTAAPNKGA
jgi:hypothetical protein